MKLIAGLGNPGPRYAESRHNIGFLVMDELARRWQVDVSRYERRFEAQIGETQRDAERVLLLRPATYMNLSGRSVGAALRYFKLTLPDLLVIYDDLDLPVGRLRIRAFGSAGGHKGMGDVLRNLSSVDIARIRIGIGKVDRSVTTDYVLGRFFPEERPLVETAIGAAADAAESWLRHGTTMTMNEFNRRRDSAERNRKQEGNRSAEGE